MSEYQLNKDIQSEYAQNCIEIANEGMDLFLRGAKESAAIEKYKVFNKNMNQFLFGVPKPSHEDFEDVFVENADIYVNEHSLAYFRMIFGQDEELPEFASEHTAHFVDWLLQKVRFIGENERKTELKNAREGFINSEERYFFSRTEKEIKKREKDLRRREMFCFKFYRNARLAEKYLHCVKSGTGETEFDMYTPVILSRMAVEQYLKAVYFQKYHTESSLSASELRKKLVAEKIIGCAWGNELCAVQRRGNISTHDSDVGDTFTLIHGIKVLAECWKRFPMGLKVYEQ